jgi:glycosyltransferase involved in cell wall biosynthesis
MDCRPSSIVHRPSSVIEAFMRILFITGEYPSMQGGVGDYTRRLSQALGALGADVHVLTHADAGGDHLRVPVAAYEPTVYPVLEHTGWTLWGETVDFVRQLRPEVVHIQYQSAAYGLHPAVNYLPWRLRALQHRPAIGATFHDLRYPYIFPKAGPLRWQAVLALARGSDASVITNPADWAQLAQASLGKKLHAIPIGSNIECQPPAGCDRTCQRTLWGAGPDTWLLAYFGFLNAGKGGETLVRALAELVRAGRPARLLMVGGKVGASDPTNQAYLERVEQLTVELGVADRVLWTGFTASDQVSANLLAADCAVLPYREGATLRHGSLMAALAHGLPIVSTQASARMDDADGLFPMLRDGESALLVPPEDPVRLAAAVEQVMSDPVLRQRLSAAAAELSRHFTWDAIACQHLEVYSKLF